MLQSKFCFWTIKWISIQTGLHSVTWRLGFGPIPFKIGHSRPIGSKNDGSLTYGQGDFGCIPPQHSTQLPWPNQDPFRGKIGNGQDRLLPVLLRIGTHIGHSSHQYADPSGRMHYDQEAMHQRWVYVMTCVYRVMDSNIHDTIHTCTAPWP